jgi:hypothetical protein
MMELLFRIAKGSRDHLSTSSDAMGTRTYAVLLAHSTVRRKPSSNETWGR